MIKFSKLDKTRYLKGVVALLLGCVLNYYGDRLLGVQVELYRGIQGFGGMWATDVFVLPFLVGLLVAKLLYVTVFVPFSVSDAELNWVRQ